jgi:hypothetical protein
VFYESQDQGEIMLLRQAVFDLYFTPNGELRNYLKIDYKALGNKMNLKELFYRD